MFLGAEKRSWLQVLSVKNQEQFVIFGIKKPPLLLVPSKRLMKMHLNVPVDSCSEFGYKIDL